MDKFDTKLTNRQDQIMMKSNRYKNRDLGSYMDPKLSDLFKSPSMLTNKSKNSSRNNL